MQEFRVGNLSLPSASCVLWVEAVRVWRFARTEQVGLSKSVKWKAGEEKNLSGHRWALRELRADVQDMCRAQAVRPYQTSPSI